MTREREGLLLCLVSAAGFGAMPIFAKQAYAEGLGVTPLLALRFAIAAAMLWTLIALRRRPLGSLRGLAAGAALGLVRLLHPGRPLLRRARAHRRGPRLAAALRLSRVRHGRGHRAAPRVAQPPQARRARRSPRAASRSCCSAAARARSTRSAPPWRSARRSSTRSSSSPPTASPPHAALPFAASVATGAAVTFGVAALLEGGISATAEGGDVGGRSSPPSRP